MTRRFFLQIFGLLFLASCDNSNQTASQRVDSDTTKKDKIEHLYKDNIDLADTVDATICINCSTLIKTKLEFFEISKTQFIKYKKNYHNKLTVDSSRIELKDTLFFIKTAKSKLPFNIEYNQSYGNRRGFSWFGYKGYVDELKVYVLENWWETGEFTLGESFLIDSSSNIKYTLNSLLDGPNNPPVISPNDKFLISFSNDGTSPEGFCRFNVIKITKTNNSLKYEGYINHEADGWYISEIVWINDSSFALKTNSMTYDNSSGSWVDNFAYLKTTLP